MKGCYGGAARLEVGEAIAEAADEPEDDYSARWEPETKTVPNALTLTRFPRLASSLLVGGPWPPSLLAAPLRFLDQLDDSAGMGVGRVLGEPTLADGILDRLVHNAHRIEMRGDSMRKNRGKSNS
jgi:hypothetical protein